MWLLFITHENKKSIPTTVPVVSVRTVSELVPSKCICDM